MIFSYSRHASGCKLIELFPNGRKAVNSVDSKMRNFYLCFKNTTLHGTVVAAWASSRGTAGVGCRGVSVRGFDANHTDSDVQKTPTGRAGRHPLLRYYRRIKQASGRRQCSRGRRLLSVNAFIKHASLQPTSSSGTEEKPLSALCLLPPPPPLTSS